MNQIVDRTVFGGTVRVDVFLDRAVRTPLFDHEAIVAEEVRTAALLATDEMIGIHRAKVLRVSPGSIVVEAVHGNLALEHYGSSGQEIYFIEEQLCDYVQGLHILGVCLADVADMDSDPSTILAKADRFLVDRGKKFGGRMVDVDGNGLSSILLAQEVRQCIGRKEGGIVELEAQLQLHEAADDMTIQRGLEWLAKPISKANRNRVERMVIDHEKFESVGGFIKVTLGIMPENLSTRVDSLVVLQELSRFQSNSKIAAYCLESKHPLIKDLAKKVEVFNQHNFRKIMYRATSGVIDQEQITAFQKEYDDIESITKEILATTVAPQSFATRFRQELVTELTEIMGRYKCTDNNLSRHIEMILNNIKSGDMTTKMFVEIRKLGVIKDSEALETMVRDWSTVAAVASEMRRKNWLISSEQAMEFVKSWKIELNEITSMFKHYDLVDPNKRREVANYLKLAYAKLIMRFDTAQVMQ